MTVFYIQVAFNLICCYWIFRSLSAERRIQRLLSEINAIKMEISQEGAASYVDREPQVEVSTTTIAEKLVVKEARVLDNYDRAKHLIKEGKDLSQVAAKTGLSVSELRLLDKFESREV